MSVKWPRPPARRTGCRTAGAADLLLDGLVTRFTEGYAPSVAPLSRALRAFADPDGGRGRRALAVAGVPPRPGSLGRRALARARDARRAPRARHRRAQPARECAQLCRRVQRPFRGLRHCRGADRRGRCDHASDRTPAAQVRGVQAGRVARRSGADAGVPRARVGECDGARRRLRRSACTGVLPRCCTTATASTARRSRPRGRRASTRTSWCTAGPSSSWSRPASATDSRTRPPPRSTALSERTQASGTEWALGVEARCRALLSDDEACYQRVDRAARAQPRRGRARAEPARVRRVAPAQEPPHGRTRAPPLRPRELQPHGRRSVRRACPPRAPRHRRNRAPENRGHARHPDAAGASGREVGPRRAHQPGDRSPALHQPADGRVPPGQGVREARGQEPQGAPRRARGRAPSQVVALRTLVR